MVEHHFEIGVIVAKRKLNGLWAEYAWLPYAVLPGVPSTRPLTQLGASGPHQLFYAGSSVLVLHASEAAHYRDNLAFGRPSLWVSLRLTGADGCGIAGVTADPYEAEALTEGIGAIVEPVAMPMQIQTRIAAFVDAFHVERPFLKRERDHANPEALAHRPAALTGARTEGG